MVELANHARLLALVRRALRVERTQPFSYWQLLHGERPVGREAVKQGYLRSEPTLEPYRLTVTDKGIDFIRRKLDTRPNSRQTSYWHETTGPFGEDTARCGHLLRTPTEWKHYGEGYLEPLILVSLDLLQEHPNVITRK